MEMLQTVETDFAWDPRRDPFVKTHPRGLICLHSLGPMALRIESQQEALSLVCIDEKSELKGTFPMIYPRGLLCRMPRLRSCPLAGIPFERCPEP